VRRRTLDERAADVRMEENESQDFAMRLNEADGIKKPGDKAYPF